MTRRYSAALLLAGALALVAGRVIANSYPGTAWPDDRPQTTCWLPNPTGGWPQALVDHWVYMDTTVQNATGNDFVYHTFCDNETDIRYDNFLTDNTAFGRATCRWGAQDGARWECRSWTVSLNMPAINQGADSAGFSRYWVERFNWCHETGHAMGLHHDTSSSQCMSTGVNFVTVYSAHDISHMNSI